ncbi:hypothetical protein EG830_01475 [bacterium]|nr:hypothetical protein [bacterium]
MNSYVSTCGVLYNHHALADPHGLCTIGWQVPSDAKWTNLTDYLGVESIAGGKLTPVCK